MITNRVYKLKKDALVGPNMPLTAGKEIEIVMDVIYIDGNMVDPLLQDVFYRWITNNPTLFIDTTKNW